MNAERVGAGVESDNLGDTRLEALIVGTGAAKGVAIGPAVVIHKTEFHIPHIENPLAAFTNAMAAVQAELTHLQERTAKAGRTEAAEVLGAQALMAEDPMFADSVTSKLAEGATLEEAVANTSAEIAEMFASINDPYIAARATDVAEVTDRLRHHLATSTPANQTTFDPTTLDPANPDSTTFEPAPPNSTNPDSTTPEPANLHQPMHDSVHLVGLADHPSPEPANLDQTMPDLSAIEEPSILVAEAITAAETALLDPNKVLGFITEAGGPTSHVAIIARSLGVASVVGAKGVVGQTKTGDIVALNGTTGEVAIRPTAETKATFETAQAQHNAAQQAAAQLRGKRVSLGTKEIAVPANVGSKADIETAAAEGADGIGLLRTEFLFLDRSAPPSEAEQYDLYSFAAKSFTDTVVIRTFDIGGDKPAPYLQIPAEENPFLGVRGARLYAQEADLFNAQVRAIMRAATHGEVALMLPMVSDIIEIRKIRAEISQIAAQLAAEGAEHKVPPIGVMVEVPALALVADAIAPEVDFFSLGTNDLTQYTLAADRTNGSLDEFQDPLHPAVLALCKMTADAAHRNNITASVCGLAAADPAGTAILASLGIDKLSVSSRYVNPTKSVIASLTPKVAHQLATQALKAATASEVREFSNTALAGGDAHD